MENKVSIDMYYYNQLMMTKITYDLLLTAIFDSADLIIGYNHEQFDLPLLQNESNPSVISSLSKAIYKVKNSYFFSSLANFLRVTIRCKTRKIKLKIEDCL